MLDVNTSKNNDGSRRPDSTDSLHLTPTHQEPHEHPWLSRAGYFLRGDELETLTLPESEGLSARNPTYFSRLFLSKFLGGSQQPAYTNVMFNHNHIYHLGAYYVGKTEWNPQFPKELGEHGALLVVGTSFERPPVPWPTSQEVYPGGHRAQFKPVNCFVKRSSAEYEYIGLYAFHAEFRKLTEREVEKHVPKAAWDLWTKGIDMSQWGAKLKCKLVATTNADNGNAQVGAPETRKAEELFKLPDDNPGKLCFYWQVVDSSLDIKNRLTAYVSIWNISGTTETV